MFLVDSHCHLHLMDLSSDEAIFKTIQRAHEQSVHHFLNVSVQLKNFRELIKLAEKHKEINISVGLHPNEIDDSFNETILLDYAKHPKVVAIGETGLDYFRSEGDLIWQQDRFRVHIRVAKEKKLPLIIHTRNAKQDTLDIMQQENAFEVQGVMHCFTEDWETAKKALDMGFYISFSGIVTFKNANTIQDVAKKVPLDRMLVETDCPYLAPVPFRGKANEPAYVRYTAEFIANLRQVELEFLAETTTNNFFNLFKGAVRTHV